jgi:hypothetical protein
LRWPSPPWRKSTTGRGPAKKDIPYVLRAAQLIPTEAVTARQEGKKDARRSPNRFS